MKTFKDYLDQTGEYGIAEQVKHPIVIGSGLPHAKLGEMVVFESGETGEIFSVDQNGFEVLVFDAAAVKVGGRIARTDSLLSIPVGEELAGQVIDPLGRAICSDARHQTLKERRVVDQKASGISSRTRITKNFETGVVVADMLIPLGRGQRELIIGDRKTGKTSFLLSAAKTQARQGVMIIYAAIGKKKSDIKKLQEFFREEKISDKVVLVASDSNDSPGLIHVTPYSAMTIAEYFRDLGRETLVILDDLSTHARFYREISLLAGRFPGRDSYPGDIFYVHSKLLERAGNFKMGGKEVSITCLPVAETVEGDLTGYIATNLMGMTDGHIFFDSNVYSRGVRPAINIFLSVSRVGRQTQSLLKREINRALTAFLAEYDRRQNYSHFGAELSPQVVAQLQRGERLYEFFRQHYSEEIPQEVQLVLFALIWQDKLQDRVDVARNKLLERYEKDKTLFQKALQAETLEQLIKNVSEIEL